MGNGAIAFQATDCLKCGAQRILGASCGDCGSRPRPDEVNAHVVRRKTLLSSIEKRIAELQAAAPIEPRVPSSEEIGSTIDGTTNALKSFLAGMENPERVEKLAVAVAKLSELRDSAAASPAWRPEIPVRNATIAALESGYLYWSDFKEALTGATMHEAQRLSNRGQGRLSSVGKSYAEHVGARTAADAFDGAPETPLFERVFKGIERNYPGVSILEVDKRGRAEATKLTGVEVGEGMGAEFLTLNTIAAAHLDGPRTRRVLAESARFCANSPLVVSVAKSEGVLGGLATSRRRLAEAMNAFELVIRTVANDETAFNRMMRLHAEVYEEVAGPIFALYLLISGVKSRPYLKLIGDGATKSSDALSNSPQLDEWFLGRDTFLRNAAQHGGGYRVEGDNVVFTLNSYSGTHPMREIIDMILANFESLAATSWALRNAFEIAGIEVPLSDSDAEYLGLSGIDLSRVMLEHHGLSVEVTSRGEHWDFTVSGEEVNPFTLALVIAMSEAARQIHTVTVGLKGAGEDTMELELSTYREFAANEGKAQGAAAVQGILELRHACQVGGRGILTASDLAYAATHGGALLLSGNHSHIGLLRRTRTLAGEYGFHEVERLTTEVFDAFRRNQPSATEELQRRLITLGQATSAPVAPTNDRVRVLLANS